MRFLLAATLGLGFCASVSAADPSLFHNKAVSPTTTSKPRPLLDSKKLKEQLRAANASGVLLSWTTDQVLLIEGKQITARPGSILKPLLLAYALRHGIVNANKQVYCRRTLRVGKRSLPCSHPDDQPMLNAKGALAESCNTWFAYLARRMTPQDMHGALRQAGLPDTAHTLDDVDTRVLTALGLENLSVTPMQIATAYRELLLHEPHTSAVWNGLRDSVAYGMASNARIKNLEVLGKTGTASNAGEWWTHGWFAGGIPGRVVLVIYQPRGDGGTAATLAGELLRQLQQEGF